ncbi:AMP-binding protein [Amycolatopsis methanolica]|uniref:Long-chain-fatty-acid--CoA ligase n=1 Tax=Amycolatopsis methanolica 239 TaxID=1068978 RepID=A0A076N432_AMYME|nr:AMP-binding protein [Amycolatopsis methanolica]AIJ25575.1 long-chain-fatty-acid--CoA ligase [Amycolatopsis methanolica 239]
MTGAGELGVNLIQRVNVGDLLTRSAARFPARLAVADGERRLSYADFNALVNRTAHGLLALGYTRGDALAVASGNSLEFLATYFACAKTGIVCVPVNLGWRPNEVTYVLEHSRARGIVVESQLAAAMVPAIAGAGGVREVIVAPGTVTAGLPRPVDRRWLTFAELGADRPGTDPECYVADRDPLSYLYTSGTTSFPKGVVGNHTAIYLESLSVALEARFAEDDRIVAMMPMFHTAQLNAFCTPAVAVGAAQYLRRGFEPGPLLDLIERERVTQLFGLPMMYRAMLDEPGVGERDLSSLRRACYAMAPMPHDQLRRCLEVFACDFYLLFGQTEMSPVATFFRPEHQLSHPGAVGTPVTNVQVGIMAGDGRLLPAGQKGEIVYRGPHTLSEYLRNPEATAEAFAHGWFHSGDVGLFDDDGVLWFADRRKDVIKTGGENVASIEVEKAVYEVEPDIAEAVVVGLPHDHWSEAITAVVVPRPGTRLDPQAIITGVKQRIDPYKAPKSVIVTDELPRTSTGKIQKNVVRQRYADHYRRTPES